MHKIDAPGATENNRFTDGDPAASIAATEVSAAWLNAIQSELVKVIESAGLTLKNSEGETGDQLLAAMQAMGVGTGQFQNYSSLRTYSTGEVARGSDGHFYEFYDRDGNGSVVGVDPTDPLNRPHIWMRWDGVRPATVIEWRSETIPEGYVKIIGDDISRTDYRRIWDAWGTTYGEGDGATTFGTFDDRGQFKRGWDDGRGVDAGRALAISQDDMLKAHDHSAHTTLGGAPDTGTSVMRSAANSDLSGSGLSSRVSETGGTETRPRNNAVIWLTKI